MGKTEKGSYLTRRQFFKVAGVAVGTALGLDVGPVFAQDPFPLASARELNLETNDLVTVPESITTTRQYNEQYGGYATVTSEGKPQIYRNIIREDSVVVDTINTSFGSIGLEMPRLWQGVEYHNQTQIEWSQKARDVMEQGMREYYIVAYEQAYNVDRAQAETLLQNGTPIPLTWVRNILEWTRGDVLTEANSWIRFIDPSKGISFIVLDETYPYDEQHTTQYPNLAISYTSSGIPAYIYGFEVEENGRLVIVAFRDGESSINKSNLFSYGVLDSLRAMGTDRNFNIAVDYHTDYKVIFEYMRDVTEQFGIGRFHPEEYANIVDVEAFSLIKAK